MLLLVAERHSDGRFTAVQERAEITRLGRGVDENKTLSLEAIETTLTVIERFAHEARELGAHNIVVTATSAARDASNGHVFLAAAKKRAGVEIEIISGDEEARLSFASAFSDFGGPVPLVVIDIGGGSTELIYGTPSGDISYRHSFDVGSVRLTERCIKTDPPNRKELDEVRALLSSTFTALPAPPRDFRLVGIAGTVTTLCAVVRRVEPYNSALIHGATLSVEELGTSLSRLASLPTVLRKTVPGIQPKRADVIVAGGLILQAALAQLACAQITVSDRGLRWGLLASRFGATS